MLDFITYHTPIFYLIQSIWRDEAFSYFMAKPDIIQVIINTANDFNPPLYYLFLHFWMQVVGKSDEMLRILSLIPHLLSVYVAYNLAQRLFSKRFAIFVAAFTLFNPMLLYYAFEMRMYSFYALFVFCSLYFFYIKNWKWYTITTALGLFTHSFFPLIPVSFVIYLWLIRELNKKLFFLVLKPFLFYFFWLPILANQFLHSGNSWMFPVDFQLIKSVLGNLFINYEGTPGGLWPATAKFSAVILIFCLIAFLRKRKQALMLLTPVFVPLILILGFSTLRRPIYVNRYMIFVTVFEIIAISLGLWSIKNKIIKVILASLWIVFIVFVNLAIPPYRKKTDFKTTYMEINKMAKPDDYVYTKTPIAFLESAYYYQEPTHVFVFNPDNITIPNYIGATVVFPNISKSYFPSSPSRTFLVSDDASFEVIINK